MLLFNFSIALDFPEACIYAIYSIAEHIESDERTGLPKFIMILSEIPYDKLHEKLLGTALDSIGKILATYLSHSPFKPTHLE